MQQNATEKVPKSSKFFVCKLCDFTCSRNSQWERHVSTDKHKNNQNATFCNKKVPKSSKIYICENCEKNYKDRSSLWRHKKICIIEYAPDIEKDNSVKFDKNMILSLLNQNNELQKQLIELSKEKGNTYINNCNNKFNLNLFLNEQCKDALNITDFVSSLQLQSQDLENTGELGFVEGISKIFVKGLKELDIYKRPLHCSDLKREILYIKDADKWEKENDEKDKLKGAIKEIASKNMKQLPQWIGKNPHYYDSTNRQNDTYLKIIGNSMSGATKAESDNNYQKIMHNIAKEVVIDKE